ncbi:hypothetical protein A0123_02824 [Gluconobacter cerinus]|uniref:Uncharacterized protein n=1 Tax=Gluconobacter cerinus TaxID=38307 RepID=A0A1B6VHI8_9PROT|nr:hypothetical protein A0123_02824 [Gluconobacter cerinus]
MIALIRVPPRMLIVAAEFAPAYPIGKGMAAFFASTVLVSPVGGLISGSRSLWSGRH